MICCWAKLCQGTWNTAVDLLGKSTPCTFDPGLCLQYVVESRKSTRPAHHRPGGEDQISLATPGIPNVLVNAIVYRVTLVISNKFNSEFEIWFAFPFLVFFFSLLRLIISNCSPGVGNLPPAFFSAACCTRAIVTLKLLWEKSSNFSRCTVVFDPLAAWHEAVRFDFPWVLHHEQCEQWFLHPPAPRLFEFTLQNINSDPRRATTTVNHQACSLGSSFTPEAADGTVGREPEKPSWKEIRVSWWVACGMI